MYYRDFSESVTSYLNGYRIVRDWRCGVRRVRVFNPYGWLMTKEQVKKTFDFIMATKGSQRPAA
jgi:hypothetical protein